MDSLTQPIWCANDSELMFKDPIHCSTLSELSAVLHYESVLASRSTMSGQLGDPISSTVFMAFYSISLDNYFAELQCYTSMRPFLDRNLSSTSFMTPSNVSWELLVQLKPIFWKFDA